MLCFVDHSPSFIRDTIWLLERRLSLSWGSCCLSLPINRSQCHENSRGSWSKYYQHVAISDSKSFPAETSSLKRENRKRCELADSKYLFVDQHVWKCSHTRYFFSCIVGSSSSTSIRIANSFLLIYLTSLPAVGQMETKTDTESKNKEYKKEYYP